jgi:RpiB/LacA/LacB family sugar-phosphate isomerase
MVKLIFGSDHAGYELKKYLIEKLNKENKKEEERIVKYNTIYTISLPIKGTYEILDVGCFSNENKYDYPDIAKLVSRTIIKTDSIGVLICGTGIGISIAANKTKDIRCAVCHNIETAKMAKKHNNANIIALGARILSKDSAFKILKTFLEETFQGGRHQIRIDKIE